jgi:nucleoside-diphosphate-sugar epimerase
MRYCVTGATGFIGGHVVRQLVASGHQVIAPVREPAKAQALVSLGVDVPAGDITNRESLRASMKDVDGVFHIAGWYKVGVRDTRPAVPINVEGTRNVLSLMQELGVPKGVYTSTLGVFSDTHGQQVDETYRHAGPWLSAYERTKWQAHYEVAEPLMRAGLPLVIVMPGVTYGPGDTSWVRPLFVDYLQGRMRAIPQRTGFCWAHVDDTAQAHLLAMERGQPGETYIIAGPPHTLEEVFALAERLTGIPAPRRRVSPRLLKFLAMLTRSERLRVGAGVTYWGSNAKARHELGFDPRPLETGLGGTLDHEMQLLGITSPPAHGA